jgi:hypothetical protein
MYRETTQYELWLNVCRVKAVGGLLVAMACGGTLWLTHMDRSPELPPLRPLQQPTHTHVPVPEPKESWPGAKDDGPITDKDLLDAIEGNKP